MNLNIPRPTWRKPEPPKSFWQKIFTGLFGTLGGFLAVIPIPKNIFSRPMSYFVRMLEQKPEEKTKAKAPDQKVKEIISQDVSRQVALWSEAADADKSVDVYKVSPGDSLWKIAQSQYGDGTRWIDIWTANRIAIKEPNLIFAGQELKIPKTIFRRTALLGNAVKASQKSAVKTAGGELIKKQIVTVARSIEQTGLKTVAPINQKLTTAEITGEQKTIALQVVNQINGNIIDARNYARQAESITDFNANSVDLSVRTLDLGRETIQLAQQAAEVILAPTSAPTASTTESLELSQTVGSAVAAGAAQATTVTTEQQIVNTAAKVRSALGADSSLLAPGVAKTAADQNANAPTKVQVALDQGKISYAVGYAAGAADVAIIANAASPGSPEAALATKYAEQAAQILAVNGDSQQINQIISQVSTNLDEALLQGAGGGVNVGTTGASSGPSASSDPSDSVAAGVAAALPSAFDATLGQLTFGLLGTEPTMSTEVQVALGIVSLVASFVGVPGLSVAVALGVGINTAISNAAVGQAVSAAVASEGPNIGSSIGVVGNVAPPGTTLGDPEGVANADAAAVNAEAAADAAQTTEAAVNNAEAVNAAEAAAEAQANVNTAAQGGVAGQQGAAGATFGTGASSAPGQAGGEGLTGVTGVTGAVDGPGVPSTDVTPQVDVAPEVTEDYSGNPPGAPPGPPGPPGPAPTEGVTGPPGPTDAGPGPGPAGEGGVTGEGGTGSGTGTGAGDGSAGGTGGTAGDAS